jgi:hypothetical protein
VVVTDDWVSASEIAAYEYCARAYWLECVQHVERPRGTAARLESGVQHHGAHGRRVAAQQWLVRSAILLLIAAAALVWARARG